MGKQMLEDIKELFQAFIAPQLEGIKGDIRALDVKLDAKISALDTKIESYRRELIAEIRRVEETLSTDFVRLEQKVDLRLASMDEKLEAFRRELLAEIKAASK
jgi:uncharacterized protein YqgV (UPF0045/DUF77 family)